MPDAFSPDTFEPHVGSEFSIKRGPGPLVLLQLDKVDRHEPRSHGDRRDPFALLFVGPGGQPLPQAIYPMDHDMLGRLDIFVVPIGPLPDGRQQYEAVFN